MNNTSTRKLTAVLMVGAATLAGAGFTALGAIFEYPKILKAPTAEILADFRAHQGAVTAWFAVLAVSAALLVPVGILLGRLAGGRLLPWIVGTAVAAAAVQVAGLSRWFLFVPGISSAAADPTRRPDAEQTFRALHFWLGTIIGETIGYALTAAFTVLVVVAFRTAVPRWLGWLGAGSAVLIATGVVVPLGVGIASLTNFVGYVAWCLWLIAMGVALWRGRNTSAAEPALQRSVA